MKKLKSWIIGIFAYHTLLANPKLGEDDAENTVKIAAMIAVCLPLLAVLVAFIVVASNPEALESVKAVIVVSALVIYFGVSSVTGRLYDRNKNRFIKLPQKFRQTQSKESRGHVVELPRSIS